MTSDNIDLEKQSLEMSCRPNRESPNKLPERYLTNVVSVRRNAISNFKEEPVQAYVYGTAVQHMILLTYKRWDELRALRILGVIYASLDWLANEGSASTQK